MLYLFNSLKLTLAGQEVEHVNYPGHATSLLGLASYSSDYQKLVQGWCPDSDLTAEHERGRECPKIYLVR